MKKHRLLLLILAIILVASSGSIVKAADGLEKNVSLKNAWETIEKESNNGVHTYTSASDNPTVVRGSVPVFNINTGDEKIDKFGDIVIYAKDKAVNNKYQYKQAITFKSKGSLIFAGTTVAKTNSAESRESWFGLYYDADLTKPVDSYKVFTTREELENDSVFKVPKAGTYYLGIYIPAKPSSDTVNDAWEVIALGGFTSGSDRTLSNGKQIAVGHKSPQTNYFKFKATQTGYVTAMADKDSKNSVKVTLCNSKKKAISGNRYVRYTPTYGVTKGKTYYFKVESAYRRDGGYIFKVNNNKITEKSGKSKSKAVSLKKKKTVKGTIQAGSSQADWYKIKLTGKKNVNILWKAKTNDQMKVTVYQGKKAITTKTFFYNNSSISLKSIGKWPKGTYYIKVYRGNAKSSGWYSLNWKK